MLLKRTEMPLTLVFDTSILKNAVWNCLALKTRTCIHHKKRSKLKGEFLRSEERET